MTNQQRILVVDDEEDLREILRFDLEAEGFAVQTAARASEAEQLLACDRFDLILLDVMMERTSGFELAATLRQSGVQTPIIFLTALATNDAQLQGFANGADDYITKPFSFPTVLARIRAVLRRSSTPAAQPEQQTLTRREHLIYQLLASQPGHYFSREQIIASVWPGDTYVLPRSVDVHIARLRKKLGPAEGARIINRTGFGYALV